MIVEVALPLPIDSTFSYSVPAEWQGDLGPGYRVVVPFGSRTMTGVVLSVESKAEDESRLSLKSIEDVPDTYPALTDGLLKVAGWISEYYVCGIGEAMRAALPPGIEIQSETVVQLTDRPLDEIDTGGEVGDLLDYLAGRGQVPVKTIQRRFRSMSTARLRRLERDDVLNIESRLRGPRASTRTVRYARLAPSIAHAEAARSTMLELRGAKQRTVVSELLKRLLDGEDEVPVGVTFA